MQQPIGPIAAAIACAVLALPGLAAAQTPPGLTTPDKVDTSIGALDFRDGAPSVATAEKVRDALAFTAALNVFNNSFRGASAYALGKGFQSIGAEDNTPIIFSELMDAKSLFLTANADTVYYMAVVNLSQGPMVVEQPPLGLGTINDMWFSWIIDIGFPGPDRGEGGKYLLVPPGYDGPPPEGGFFVARSRTNRVLYAARSFQARVSCGRHRTISQGQRVRATVSWRQRHAHSQRVRSRSPLPLERLSVRSARIHDAPLDPGERREIWGPPSPDRAFAMTRHAA
jgi:hypothetical protein